MYTLYFSVYELVLFSLSLFFFKASSILSVLYSRWEKVLRDAIEKELQDYRDCLQTMEENWCKYGG